VGTKEVMSFPGDEIFSLIVDQNLPSQVFRKLYLMLSSGKVKMSTIDFDIKFSLLQ
jgi:hypothetical protein